VEELRKVSENGDWLSAVDDNLPPWLDIDDLLGWFTVENGVVYFHFSEEYYPPDGHQRFFL